MSEKLIYARTLISFFAELLNWGIFSASERFIEDYHRNLMCWKKPKTNSE
jgi:hypothetical protein